MPPYRSNVLMQSAATIEQDADLWFSDGSIVVIAEGTGFRVNVSVLSRFSPVFCDIFRLPQPAPCNGSDGNGAFQGVPVVHVSDTAHDMRCLLHAIYDSRKYLSDMAPDGIPFSVLSTLTRLGYKYELTGIVDEAMQYLEELFTAEFDVWLELCQYREEKIPTFYFSDEEEAELFECVKLMRLTGQTAMLPHTLYTCCQLGLTDILVGGERSAGPYEQLGHEDVEHCIFGHVRLLQLSGNLLPGLMAAGACTADCVSQEACSERLQVLVQTVAVSSPALLTADALAGLERRLCGRITALDCWTGLCDACHGDAARDTELASEYL